MHDVMTRIDGRKRNILRAVVDEHIRTAEPVGSRTICRHYGLNVSSATVRNDLCALEEMDLIHQPHTSAGRVPSDLGYRVYVEELMQPQPVEQLAAAPLETTALREAGDATAALRTACRMLSDFTGYTAFILMPQVSRDRMRHLQIGRIEHSRLLVLLVTSSGHVEHHLFDVDFKISNTRLEAVARYLNQRLRGLSLQDVKTVDVETMAREDGFHDADLGRVFELVKASIADDLRDRILVEGVVCILGQPEFRDVEKARNVLTVLEVPGRMALLADGLIAVEGVAVSIGEELGILPLSDCSVVGTSYGVPAGVVGSIGVVGPKRMKYSASVSSVEYVAHALSEYLQQTVE